MAKGTSPHIPGSECPLGSVSPLGVARAGAGARRGRHDLETGSGCGNNVILAHTTSHSQAGDGLGHYWGSQSLGTGTARGSLNPEPPLPRRPYHHDYPNLAAATGVRSIPRCYLALFSMVVSMHLSCFLK